MREKIQGKAGKFFMGFLFLTFFGGVGISKFVMNLIADSDAVVIVNKLPMSHTLFSQRVVQEEQKINAFKEKYGQHADLVMRIMGVSNDPYGTALKVVTYQGIIESCYRSMGLHLAPEYVTLKKSDPYFLANTMRQQFPNEQIDNPIALYQMIQNSPRHQQFEDQLMMDMQNDFMQSMLRGGLFVPVTMYEHHHKMMMMSKKFGVQTFALPFFVEQARKAGATTEQLKSFLN